MLKPERGISTAKYEQLLYQTQHIGTCKSDYTKDYALN
jgi:hypothetical protein